MSFNFRATEADRKLFRSFKQIAGSEELRSHFSVGEEICSKHLQIFQTILTENGLPKLMTWEGEVTPGRETPFSDRLMLFFNSSLTASSASHYGAMIPLVMRKDLGADFARMMSEVVNFGEDALKLLIKNKYLDQIPLA